MVNLNFLWESIGNSLRSIYTNPLVFIVILLFLLFASYTDIKSFLIYNKMNLLFLICRIIFIFIPVYSLGFNLEYLIGGVLGALFLMIPAMYLMKNMGGDIKLMAVLGLYLGAYNITILLYLSCITMLLFNFGRKLITKQSVLKLDTPYAPFFTVSFLIMGLIYIFLF